MILQMFNELVFTLSFFMLLLEEIKIDGFMDIVLGYIYYFFIGLDHWPQVTTIKQVSLYVS